MRWLAWLAASLLFPAWLPPILALATDESATVSLEALGQWTDAVPLGEPPYATVAFRYTPTDTGHYEMSYRIGALPTADRIRLFALQDSLNGGPFLSAGSEIPFPQERTWPPPEWVRSFALQFSFSREHQDGDRVIHLSEYYEVVFQNPLPQPAADDPDTAVPAPQTLTFTQSAQVQEIPLGTPPFVRVRVAVTETTPQGMPLGNRWLDVNLTRLRMDGLDSDRLLHTTILGRPADLGVGNIEIMSAGLAVSYTHPIPSGVFFPVHSDFHFRIVPAEPIQISMVLPFYDYTHGRNLEFPLTLAVAFAPAVSAPAAVPLPANRTLLPNESALPNSTLPNPSANRSQPASETPIPPEPSSGALPGAPPVAPPARSGPAVEELQAPVEAVLPGLSKGDAPALRLRQARAKKALVLEKSVPEPLPTGMRRRLRLLPKAGQRAANVSLYERVPKSVAPSADAIRIQGLSVDEYAVKVAADSGGAIRFEVLERDPLLAWHFAQVEAPVEISYEVESASLEPTQTLVTAEEPASAPAPVVERPAVPSWQQWLWLPILALILLPVLARAWAHRPKMPRPAHPDPHGALGPRESLFDLPSTESVHSHVGARKEEKKDRA